MNNLTQAYENGEENAHKKHDHSNTTTDGGPVECWTTVSYVPNICGLGLGMFS